MKKIIIIMALIPVLGFSQEVKSEIALAGDQLAIYQNKQLVSKAMLVGGIGLIALSTLNEDTKPAVYLGGFVIGYSVKINIESLFNLKRVSNHLKNHKQQFLKY